MKALVKKEAKPGLWLDDVPEPEIGINDVLIRVAKTGICGTDLHIYKWDEWAQKTIPVPMVVGHEFVGTIVKVGSNVSDFHPGDLASGEGHVVCGRCRNCLAGRRHLCAKTQGIGVNRPGAFAEYIALPMTNIWRHHPDINLEVASIFDPFGNAVHTALTFPVLGEDVLITGAGPIGIMAAAVVKHSGARFVVITDVNPWRLELASKLGITMTVDSRTKRLADVQKELGMQEGFDVGLEMSGNESAFREMLANMSHGARIAMLGIPSKPDHHRLEPGYFQHAHHKGHLRPRDVRDLVQDDRDAAVRSRHHPGHHPPTPPHRIRNGPSSHGLRRGRQSHPRLVGDGPGELLSLLAFTSKSGAKTDLIHDFRPPFFARKPVLSATFPLFQKNEPQNRK